MSKKSELSTIIMDEMNKLGLKDWLDKEESIKSSRLNETLKCIKKHKNEKVIVFSCFRSFMDIGEYLIGKEMKDRPLFRMIASMSAEKRAQLIKDFEKSKNGILLLTYQLGAEGLNLQFASTILLVDFWWNASKEQQAIGRIFRFGQVSDEINVYFFTTNTGIEKILFEKQQAKLKILDELRTGKMKTKIPFIKLDDVIKLIELSDNEELLKEIKFY
jgi:SNF2 family DNA or RNA helicase